MLVIVSVTWREWPAINEPIRADVANSDAVLPWMLTRYDGTVRPRS